MLAELKEITAKKREIRFSRMSDPIWIFLNFFGGFFRIVDVNPVSIDNSDFKIIPSSVCGQGGPAKKKKYVPGSKPCTCFFVFFDRSARPPGGWASTLGDRDPVGVVGQVYGAIHPTTTRTHQTTTFNHAVMVQLWVIQPIIRPYPPQHTKPRSFWCSFGLFWGVSTSHPTTHPPNHTKRTAFWVNGRVNEAHQTTTQWH